MTAPFSTPSERWAALQRRDPDANSAFLYGVHSTRIYCRPTCPGRLARRANIVFFDNLQEAQQSGYRPCKRCQPCNDSWNRDSQGQQLVDHAKDIIVTAVMEHREWTVESVAREINISGGHLHRLFKKYLHAPPKAFAATLSTTPSEGPASSVPETPSPSLSQLPPVDPNFTMWDWWSNSNPYDSETSPSSGGEWQTEDYSDLFQCNMEQDGVDLFTFMSWNIDVPLPDDLGLSNPVLPKMESSILEPQ